MDSEPLAKSMIISRRKPDELTSRTRIMQYQCNVYGDSHSPNSRTLGLGKGTAVHSSNAQ